MNTTIEKKIDECFYSFIKLLNESSIPEVNTLIIFFKDTEHIFVFPHEKEDAEEFMMRAHGLKRDINPDISLVLNRNEKIKGDGRLTIAHNDSKNFKMFTKIKNTSDWEETFDSV